MYPLVIPLLIAQQFAGTDLDVRISPSFSDFGAITESGSLPGIFDGRTFEWTVGDRPEDILRLGDIDQLGPGDLTLLDISRGTGLDYTQLTLEDFPLLANSNLDDVASAVGNDPEFLDTLLIEEGKTIGEVIGEGNGGNRTLAEVLGIETPLEEIARVQDAVIGELTNYRNEAISAIPGLPLLPFARYPAQLANTSLAAISLFAKADLILDSAEQGIDNTITGSEREQTMFNTPCPPLSPCGHVELKDSLSVGMAGKRWINGSQQRVRGGSGLLGAIFDNTEPTGRLPFGPGSPFKLVLTETNETTDEASFSAYFQFCEFLAGCTGYNIGPFPLYTTGIDGDIWLGINPTQFGQIPFGFDPFVNQGPSSRGNGPGPGPSFSPPNPFGPQGDGETNKCNGTQQENFANYIWPANGPLTSGFDLNRLHPIRGVVRPHLGIDIGAPTGTPIVAVQGAVVLNTGWNGSFGNTVEIRDACTGHEFLYAHLSAINVQPGQEVRQGQQLGAVGSTGESTGPHLHFEFYENGGRPVDPLIILSN